MDRLARKFETARHARAEAGRRDRGRRRKIGIIAYGTSHWAIDESRDQLREETDVETSYLRLRGVSVHRRAGGVHRRARARLRRRAEPRRADAAADAAGADARAQIAKLRSVLHYNGLPIDARSITDDVLAQEGFEVAEDDRRARGQRGVAEPTAIAIGIEWRSMSTSHATLEKSTASASNRRSTGAARRRSAPAAATTRSPSASSTRSSRWASIPSRSSSCRASAARARARRTSSAASHGFNAVHGRMPSVGTGAMLANRKLIAIGVSGDGDTGAIGIGQFVHLMRRNLPIIYIIEDNGCYGLTKGQFSPTADLGSKLKNGVVNDLPPIDTCALAIELGATFVGAVVLGRQEAAAVAPQGGARAPRHGDARRHLAVRDLQRPRRLDQELRLREGPRRAARGGQLRAVLRGHQRRLRAGHDAGSDDARRVEAAT